MKKETLDSVLNPTPKPENLEGNYPSNYTVTSYNKAVAGKVCTIISLCLLALSFFF